jgi:predicted MFS family arabinose efflux permease
MYVLEPLRERRLLWLLAFTQFTLIMDFMVMMPLGPQIMQAFAIGPASFATAVSAYSWCGGLSGLFAATYIDRFDRRRLLLFMYALFVLSNLACAMAPTFGALLFARAFAGIASGVIGSLVLAIIGDVIPVERRGAATGIVMTAFSIAAVAGVPAGVMLGAHYGWAASFYLLVVLSIPVWFALSKLVPSLREHLATTPAPLSQTLPALWRLASQANHLRAFLLTFTMMAASMMIIPFISPVLVANHGVPLDKLAWIYMAGGAATLYTAPLIGRLSDKYGKHLVFCIIGALSTIPILIITHLPDLPFVALLAFFPFFMVLMSGRMVPLQALMTTVPEPAHRGAFLSLNSATQSLGTGCGAWIGGLLLANSADGHIHGYGTNGLVAVAIVIFGMFWVYQVKSFNGKSSVAPIEGKPAPQA